MQTRPSKASRPLPLRAALLVAACGLAQNALGELAKDPTIPPAAYAAAQAAGQLNKQANDAAPLGGSGRLVRTGAVRRIAIIDGKLIKVGDRFNGATVVAIRPDTIQTDDPTRSLPISPGLEKRPAGPAKGAKADVVLPNKTTQ